VLDRQKYQIVVYFVPLWLRVVRYSVFCILMTHSLASCGKSTCVWEGWKETSCHNIKKSGFIPLVVRRRKINIASVLLV